MTDIYSMVIIMEYVSILDNFDKYLPSETKKKKKTIEDHQAATELSMIRKTAAAAKEIKMLTAPKATKNKIISRQKSHKTVMTRLEMIQIMIVLMNMISLFRLMMRM